MACLNIFQEEKIRDKSEVIEYTFDGTVDRHGEPAIRAKTGRWGLGILILGRINYTHLVMLPKGEWPNWCKTCGGSGLGFCTRCLGTGEYRDIMGFHFLKRESNHPPKHTKRQIEGNAEHLTAADLLLSQTTSEAEE